MFGINIKVVLHLSNCFSGCDHLQGEGRGSKQLKLTTFSFTFIVII